MELSAEQLDWLTEHFCKPGRALAKPSPLEQSLIDLRLVVTETFSFGNAPDLLVLSLTRRGLAMVILYRPKAVEKHLDLLNPKFVKKVQLSKVPLDILPEFLGSDDTATREAASDRLAELLGEEQSAQFGAD